MPKKLSPETAFVTFAIHGFSGVGKTTLAATAPKPILFLNKDNGLMSLLHLPQFRDVEHEDITSVAHFERCLRNLRGLGKHDWAKKYKGGTVVIDDMSSVQDMVMEELQVKAKERDERRELDDATQKEYGVMGNRLRRWLRAIKMIPMHRIIVSAAAPSKDDGQIIPGLVGAMKFKMPHMMDALIYMRHATDKSGNRVLLLDGTEEYLAKTRAWWLPKKIIIHVGERRATLTDLIAKIAHGPAAKADKKE